MFFFEKALHLELNKINGLTAHHLPVGGRGRQGFLVGATRQFSLY